MLHDEHENVDERNHEHNDGDVSMGEGDGMDDDDDDRHNKYDDHSLGRNMNQDQMNPGSSDSQGETTFQSSESDQDMEWENNMPRHDIQVIPLHDMSQNLVGDGHVQNDNRGNNGGYEPIRNSSLTNALRNNVNMLDFGRPRGSVQPQPHVETSEEDALCTETCHGNRPKKPLQALCCLTCWPMLQVT